MDSKQKHRAVFLVDVSLASCEHCNHCNEILTSMFRLLSLFSGTRYQSQIRTNENDLTRHGQSSKKRFHDKADISPYSAPPHLSWGLKFFSTNSTLPRTKSLKCSSHSDFNSNVSEHLEKKVKEMFDSTLISGGRRKSISHPSEYLTTAFRDILHEFEWQEDQDTVVTKLSTFSSTRQDHEMNFETVRHIFIFSRVPSSKQCLRKFCNKVVLDYDVFLDCVMSPTLFSEYMEKLKIGISWVDLSSADCNGSSGLVQSHQSITIVKEAMKKLGGTLFHKDYFIHRVPFFAGSNNLNEFEYHQTPSCLNLFSTETVLPPSLTFTKQSADLKVEISCPITIPGTNSVASIKLLPLERNQKRAKDFQKVTGTVSTQTDCSNVKKPSCDIDLNGAQLELIGFVSSTEISKTVSFMDTSTSYLLNCDSDSYLMSLMRHMFWSHTFGILKIHNKSSSKRTSCLALMTAHTLDVSFVTVLSQNASLKIDDGLMHRGNSKEKEKIVSKFGNDSNFQSDLIHQHQESKSKTAIKSVKEPQNSPYKISEIFNAETLNSWHIPGTRDLLEPFINKLSDGLMDKAQFSDSEHDVLKDLKKCYLKEKQPYKLLSQPQSSTGSTPVNEMTLSQMDVSGSAESERRSSLDVSHRRSGSLSRGRLMVDKARSASLSFYDDSEGSQSSKQGNFGRRASDSLGFADLNLKTEDCLADYLLKQYNLVLGAGVAMGAAIQAMMTVTCHFMSNKEYHNPQKEAVSFIRKHLAVEPSKLKEKYDKASVEGRSDQDATEYKLQVILLMEMESFVPESDRLHQEKIVTNLISMLRPLSFASGITELRAFLENLTSSYSGALPQVLIEVHDEIDQPYPAELAKFASPSAPSSVWGHPLSIMSDSGLSGPGSSQPSSNQMSQQTKRSGRLNRHPSFADFGQKKQILVNKPETKAKAKSQVNKKKSPKDKEKQKLKPNKSRHRVDCDGAKRNLFNDSSKVTPKKRKERRQLTPKGKKEKTKLLVPGTPAHKQTSKRIIRRQQKLRKHFNIKPEIQVVAESPIKDDGKQGDNRPAKLIVRQSFYSTNSGQSRNVAKSLEQSRDENSQSVRSESLFYKTRAQGSLASAVRGESPILSPRSRMIKSFCTSPSSGEKSDGTPRSSLRRSPRKSVKRLIFTESTTSCQNNQAKKETVSARLVFDGENASDVQLASHSKRMLSPVSHEGFKTPEKKKHGSRIEGTHGSISRSSFAMSLEGKTSHKPQELNFRNVLSGHFSLPPQKGLQYTNASSSSHLSSPVRSKNTGLLPCLSSPDQAARLRSAFLQSPRKNSPARINLSFTSYNAQTMGQDSAMLFKSPTKSMHGVSPSKNLKHSHNRHEQAIFSTPTKTCHSPTEVHFTPSKVTFSDSCLVSPSYAPNEPSSAQKMTPKKSILKNSPAFKSNIIKRIREAELLSSPDKKPAGQPHVNKGMAHSPHKKTSRKHFSEVGGEMAGHKSDRRFEEVHGRGLSNEENMPGSSGIKRRILSFDATASSSSNDSSNCVHPHHVATTVVTVHSPSPTKKCKTPDMNKWMRKKRHSGSRNCSSSSSSPSLFSSSPSSNESKMKGSGARDETDGVNSKDCSENSQKDSHNLAETSVVDEQSSAQGKCLKRNLFSPEDVQMSKGKVRRTSERMSCESTVRRKKNMLPSSLSGGFDPNLEAAVVTTGVEETSPSFSQNRNISTGASSSLNSVNISIGASSSFLQEQEKSCGPFSSCSPSKLPRLTRQTSSFALECSQGFQVLSATPSSHHDKKDPVPTDSDLMPSETCLKPAEVPPKNTDQRSGNNQDSDLKNASPCSSAVRKTPTKKQFSPALSSSGLLQLIKSPLLDRDVKKSDVKARENRKGRVKSRQRLDLM